MTPSEQMLQIFAGRTDVHGGDEGKAVWQPITPHLMNRHLMGEYSFGVYPIIHDDTNELWVKWGCCDIDTGDWTEAWLLYQTLKGMGLHPYIERSRSKGWHVWVFSDKWVTAKQMRRCLKVAYATIDLKAKEANPKSEELGPTQLGNYVRLPFKGIWAGPIERQVIMRNPTATTDGTPVTLDEFLQNLEYSDSDRIISWSQKYYEPRVTVVLDSAAMLNDEQLRQLVETLPRGTRALWEKGPKNGERRSEALTALGCAVARTGRYKPEQVWQIVASADKLWGKYHIRPNGDDYITQIVNKAFNE